MELGKLTQGQKIAGAAGFVLLVALWLSWYGVDVGGGVAESILDNAGVDTTVNAWQSLDILDLLLFLTAVAAIAFAAMAALGRRVDLPVAPAQIVAGLGVISVLGIIYRILNQPGPNDAIELKYGVFVGLLAAIGVAYGGWRAMQEGTPAAHAAPARDTPPPPAPSAPAAPAAPTPTEAPPAAAPPPATPPAAAPPADPPTTAAPPPATPPAAAPPADPPTTAAPAPPATGAPADPPSTPTTPPRTDPPAVPGGAGQNP